MRIKTNLLKRLSSFSVSAALVLAAVNIGIPFVSAQASVYAKEFGFDETEINYYTAQGTNSREVTVTNGVLQGEMKAGDKLLLSFDYNLKSDETYTLSYKYKATAGLTVNADASKIGASGGTAAEIESYTALSPFMNSSLSGYVSVGEKWVTRTAVFNSGNVTDGKNRLSLRISFGADGIFCLDDIKITELSTYEKGDGYFASFSKGDVADSGVVAVHNGTKKAEIISEPANPENKVLKLHKNANTGLTASLYLPVRLESGYQYNVSYRYRVENKLQHMDASRWSFISDCDGQGGISSTANQNLRYFETKNSAANGGWGRIETVWNTAEYSFVVTENKLYAGCMALSFNALGYGDSTHAEDIYIDDIKLTKGEKLVKITLDACGGTVSETEINSVAGERLDLPTPSKKGYAFKGWYKDKDFKTAAPSVGPQVDETYYAKWSELSTDVKYTLDFNDGSLDAVSNKYYIYNDNKTTGRFYINPKGNGGNCLSLDFQPYDSNMLILDYVLENNAEYRLTYEYKCNESVGQIEASSTGILAAGDSTPLSLPTGQTWKEILLEKFKDASSYSSLGTSWTKRTVEFKTGELLDGQNRLAFRFSFAESEYSTKVCVFSIDNIKIERIHTSTAKIYANGEVEFRKYDLGTKVKFPLSGGKVGYKFEGLYVDSDFSKKVELDEDNSIMWSGTDKTYYEKWVEEPVGNTPIGAVAEYYFETREDSASSYGIYDSNIENDISSDNSFSGSALKATVAGGSALFMNFPTKLESYTKYRVTYYARGNEAQLYQADSAGSGLYLAKATEFKTADAARGNYAGYLDTKLSAFYGNFDSSVKTTTSWQMFSREFTTGYIHPGYEYLTVVIENASSDQNAEISIDNLIIEKMGNANAAGNKSFKEFTFNSEIESYMYSEQKELAAISGNGNDKALEISLNNGKTVDLVFDYSLVNGGTYTVSYDLGASDGVKLTDNSGFYAANSYAEIIENKKAFLGMEIPEKTVRHIEKTVNLGHNTVVNEYGYLMLSLCNDGKNGTVTIDNLKINKISSPDSASISFDDTENAADTFTDYALDKEQPQATVFVKIEDENKLLSVRALKDKRVLVTFPFEFSGKTTYRLKYKIKGSGTLNAAGSGVYTAKNSGKTSDDEAALSTNALRMLYTTRLKPVYSSTGSALPANWVEQELTFTTGNISATSSYKKLAMLFKPESSGYTEIYIDDIVIEKVYNIEFECNNVIEVGKITDSIGAEYSADYLYCSGYEVEGIYTDSSYNTRYTEKSFTVKAENQKFYVKYVKNPDNTSAVFKFQNEKDILADNGKGFNVASDVLDRTNKVLSLGGTDHSAVVLPYELKAGKIYALTFKYRASGEWFRVNMGIAAGTNSTKPVEVYYGGDTNRITKEKTRLYNVFGSDTDWQADYTTNYSSPTGWDERTVYFKADGELVKGDNKYLTITAEIADFMNKSIDSTLVYFDDISIKEVEKRLDFSAEFEGSKVDINPIYANVGDTVELPQKVAKPFYIIGWYSDKQLTNPVSDNYTVINDVTLYAKLGKNDTAVLDFEDENDVTFSYSKWWSSGAQRAKEPDNEKNNVLISKSLQWAYTQTRLNYQFLPEHAYDITISYKAYGTGNMQTKVDTCIVPCYIPQLDNGYGAYSYRGGGIVVEDSIVKVTMSKSLPLDWETQTIRFGTGTNGPAINDLVKYMAIMVMNKADYIQSFIYDNITITDLGAYDPALFPVKDSTSWTIPADGSETVTDWKQWGISDIEYEDFGQFDFDDIGFDSSDNSEFDEENSENGGEEESKKVIRKKKVVVYGDDNSWLVITIICIAAVLAVGGAVTAVLLIKKRKKKA